MKVFRGTRDISPAEIDHRRISQGVFGSATYFATNLSDAVMYSGGGYGDCKVVCHYELPDQDLLVIEEGEFDVKLVVDAKESRRINSKLKEKIDYQNSEIAPVNLAKISLQSGYTGVWLKGFVEGGEQVVIPEGSNSSISLLKMDISLSKRILGSSKIKNPITEFIQIMESIGIVVIEEDYYLKFSLNPKQSAEIEKYFNFIFNKLRGRSFYSINFNLLQVEEYEEY